MFFKLAKLMLNNGGNMDTPKITKIVLTLSSFQVIEVKPDDWFFKSSKVDFYYTDARYLTSYIGPFSSLHAATKDYTEYMQKTRAATAHLRQLNAIPTKDNVINVDFKNKKRLASEQL